MKKNTRYFVLVIAAAAAAVLLLAANKSKIDAGIYRDKNNVSAVNIETAAPKAVSARLFYTGITEAVNDVQVISETSGKIEKVFTDNGAYVRANTLLVKADDDILQANYKLAEVSLEKAEMDFDRLSSLVKDGSVSASDIENSRIAVKNAEAQFVLAGKYLSNASIKSPINGVLVKRYVNTGSTLAPGTPVANIIDISNVKIIINVPETDISKIKKGETASVKSPLFNGRLFNAKIINISVKADDSHNYAVELMADNHDNVFTAGMYVDVILDYSTNIPVITIPRNAVSGSIKAPRIYIVENGKAVERSVTLGGETGNRLIVLNGLNEGDKVITEGQNNLQDGTSVLIKNNGGNK